MILTDELRAAFMVLVTNIVSALVLFNLVSWSDTQIAALVAVVNTATVFAMLLFKQGQGTHPPTR